MRKRRRRQAYDLELARQQEIWYAKLAETGFVDIEYGPTSMLNSKPSALRSKANIVEKYKDFITYYSMCAAFLLEHTFQDELERVVWEYHTNGLSTYQISKVLKDVGIKKGPTQVRFRINRLKQLMKEKYSKHE